MKMLYLLNLRCKCSLLIVPVELKHLHTPLDTLNCVRICPFHAFLQSNVVFFPEMTTLRSFVNCVHRFVFSEKDARHRVRDERHTWYLRGAVTSDTFPQELLLRRHLGLRPWRPHLL